MLGTSSVIPKKRATPSCPSNDSQAEARWNWSWWFFQSGFGRNNHVRWEPVQNTWGDIAGIRAAVNRTLEDVGSVIEVNRQRR